MHSFLWRPESIILRPTILWFMLKAAMLICPNSVLAVSLRLGILRFGFFCSVGFLGVFSVFLFRGGKTWDQRSGGVSDFTSQSQPNHLEQENCSSCSFMKTSFWMEQRDLKQNFMLVIFFHILLFRSGYVETAQSVLV